jgi:hypothetical protein
MNRSTKQQNFNEASSAGRKMSNNNFVRNLMQDSNKKRKHVREDQVLCSRKAHNSIKGMINPNETVGKVYYSGGCELTAAGQECKHAQPHITSYGRKWTSKRIIKVELGKDPQATYWAGGLVYTANGMGYKSQVLNLNQYNIMYTTAGYLHKDVKTNAVGMIHEMCNKHDQSLLDTPSGQGIQRLYSICTGMKVRLLANTQPKMLEGGSFAVAQSQTKSFENFSISSILSHYPKSSIGSAADLESQDATVYPTFLGIGSIDGLQEGATTADFKRDSEGGYGIVWIEVPYVEPPAGVVAVVPAVYIEIETGGWYIGDGVPAVDRLFPDTACLLSCKAAVEAVGDANEFLHYTDANKMERAVIYHANRGEVAEAPSIMDSLTSTAKQGVAVVWRRAKQTLMKELTAAIPAIL